jgi:multicomponent Na+:H+ antiporter subunit B
MMSGFLVDAALISVLTLIAILARAAAPAVRHGDAVGRVLAGRRDALFVVLDAVDVAFTEAAVGAGISTILALATLSLVPREEKPHSALPCCRLSWPP